jgi:hypothetical protein
LIGFAGQEYIKSQNERYFEGVVRRFEARIDQMAATIDGFPDSLASNTAFQATLMQAAREAIFAEHQEKMDALCEAAVNAALPTVPEPVLRQLFVRLVGDLSDGHIRLLKFFAYPKQFGVDVEDWRGLADYKKFPMGIMPQLISERVPGFARRDMLHLFSDDLESKGLLAYTGGLYPNAGKGSLTSGTASPTNLGWDFLGFITGPKEAE